MLVQRELQGRMHTATSGRNKICQTKTTTLWPMASIFPGAHVLSVVCSGKTTHQTVSSRKLKEALILILKIMHITFFLSVLGHIQQCSGLTLCSENTTGSAQGPHGMLVLPAGPSLWPLSSRYLPIHCLKGVVFNTEILHFDQIQCICFL